jgi:peptidoglycan/xylan/chitin deacetylase (PgdA/CDA1 family)
MSTFGIPILMYHSVADETRGELAPYTLSPALFRDHMLYLCDAGYASYTVSGLLAELDRGAPLSERVVAITFDDAYADFNEAALPVLAENGLTATLYVTTGVIGAYTDWVDAHPADRRRVLSQTQLEELVAAGVECGAHTRTHPQLDVLPADAAAGEIQGSKDDLEQRIGEAVRTFAYPYGYYDRSVRRKVVEAGFDSACAVGDLVCTAASDRYALPRQTVKAGTTVAQLEQILARSPSPLALPRTRAKELAWRTARRAIATRRAFEVSR